MGERLTFEIDGNIVTFLNDFMQYVILPNGTATTRAHIFPDIDYVNWDSAYAVLKDGTLIAAREANWHVAQYDGSKQTPDYGGY